MAYCWQSVCVEIHRTCQLTSLERWLNWSPGHFSHKHLTQCYAVMTSTTMTMYCLHPAKSSLRTTKCPITVTIMKFARSSQTLRKCLVIAVRGFLTDRMCLLSITESFKALKLPRMHYKDIKGKPCNKLRLK